MNLILDPECKKKSMDMDKLIKKVARSRHCLQFSKDKRKYELLYAGKLNKMLAQEVSQILGSEVALRKVSSEELDNNLANIIKDSSEKILAEIGSELTNEEIIDNARAVIDGEVDTDAPIVKLLDSLMAVAISRGASDLHLDPEEADLVVRLRIDGSLSEYMKIDVRFFKALITRIKVLGELDITESRQPQDGRIAISYRGSPIDIRISTLPVNTGERVVLRFFKSKSFSISLEGLGLSEKLISNLRRTIASQSGILLVCGPTGSGKTTTIYSLLHTLAGRGLNITTIEDPIEVDLPNVVQSQVNEKINFNFSAGLRALLRHDPDVILVGEIRDSETADTAVRAALTGHLVISTIHANTPVGAIMRLINLGVQQSLLADALLGVYSQRLLRLYCSDCGERSVTSSAHFSDLPQIFEGCPSCFNSGFKGRIPLMDQLVMTEKNRIQLLNDLSGLTFEKNMAKEAKRFHDQGKTPLFELTRIMGL